MQDQWNQKDEEAGSFVSYMIRVHTRDHALRGPDLL